MAHIKILTIMSSGNRIIDISIYFDKECPNHLFIFDNYNNRKRFLFIQ